MVARGDLGVEMPPEEVPPLQRQIVRTCRNLGKPSIVATQMLECEPSRARGNYSGRDLFKPAASHQPAADRHYRYLYKLRLQ
jgi:hypothetical protein